MCNDLSEALVLIEKKASCKWRDAQRAMRNRKFIGYSLVHNFERDMLGKGEYQSLYKESDGRLD